jgi:Holliday junction DNA helicase RuvA
MYEYITGRLVELLPTEAVIENGGFGYSVLISLGTFSQLQKDGEEFVKLYLYHHLREEEEAFFGFYDKNERELFVQLISVSGIGPNSARMMLSSLSADELRAAIIAQDVNKLKGIKGIGLKTAQRIILELKDKVVPGSGAGTSFTVTTGDSSVRDEALSALVLLGFAKPAADKALTAVLKSDPTVSLEELIKKALKIL